MNFNKLSDDAKIAYMIKPIIQVLQEAGGQLTRTEIEERICALDDEIANFASEVTTSKKTGTTYRKFGFKFNFAIKELSFMNIVEFEKRNPLITLTDKGIAIDLTTFDANKEVVIPSKAVWEKIHEENQGKVVKQDDEEIVSDDVGIENLYNEDFKQKLLTAISKMSPKKFEMFSRLLLGKMGINFTEKGTQISNDGGIDGFGYHRDPYDFRTSKVVIQCKRFNTTSVSEPSINQFLGAMNKFQADYGIFITNSKFTKSAKEAALQGQPITLIDGDMLVELVKKYNVYVKPITTYELLDFYDEE